MSGQQAEAPKEAPAKRPGTLESLVRSLTSWRTGSVTLLSFSSGLPLGLVWISIPDWMRSSGVDIRLVGLITLSQAPWTFKFAWSPLMDRYVPPFLGRRRGWMILAQAALLLTTLSLAGLGTHPDTPWVVGAIALAVAFASATQDIAIDAYAVDVLRPEEHGIAVGARTALYRAAMFVAGGGSITLAAKISWPLVFTGLALVYLPMMLLTLKSPEPEHSVVAPKTLKDAVWYPFLGFLARHRALEILSFVVLYKLADNLGSSLLRPFLVDMGYSDFHRGVALATIAVFATVTGTFLGGALTQVMGLGHALWFFGVVQIVSNVGYIFVAQAGEPNIPLMYGALGFEQLTQGMGTGAFGVLLLRLTQRRFSATQFALFSSLFGIPRTLAGPVSGFLVYSVGWTTFFWVTIAAGIPGLLLLARFVPPGVREPEFSVKEAAPRGPLSKGRLAASATFAALAGVLLGAATTALLAALQAFKKDPNAGFHYGSAFRDFWMPASVVEWSTLVAMILFGVICGLLTAATIAARHGYGAPPEETSTR